MKIFMIGGTGLLGYESIKELIQRGHKVVSISLRPKLIPEQQCGMLELRFGNYLEMPDETIRAYMEGCEGFVFTAGVDERVEGPPPIYEMYQKYNIDPLRRLLSLAKSCGIKHAVICGSYFAYFNREWPDMRLAADHPYIRSRVEQEKLALSFSDENFDVSVLELPYIFGVQPDRKPVWMFLAEMIRSSVRYTFYPKGGTAMITIRQAGQYIAGALEKSRGAQLYPAGYYNLTWDEMLAVMHRAAGKPNNKVVHIPKWLYKLYCNSAMRTLKDKGLESGLKMQKLVDTMYTNLFIDNLAIASQLGVEPDDIENAISDSMRLCFQIMEGAVDAKEMRGE